MKIGILTLPSTLNYGGILQSYALQTVLASLGHEAFVFEQKPKRNAIQMIPVYAVRICRNFFSHAKTDVFAEKKKYMHGQNTIKFVNKYIHQCKIKKLEEVSQNDIDAIVVGSDQIWRREFLQSAWGVNNYFNFTRDWNIKRVVYAASFGVDSWEYSDIETSLFTNCLKQYTAISVREDSGIDLCARHLDVSAEHVVDPTLLLPKEEYTKLFISNGTPVSKGELMTYIFSKSEDKDLLVDRISRQYNLKRFDSYPDGVLPSVEQWLRGFYDAKFIVTDSFHACVFAIIFRKPFIVFGNKGRGLARFESLLKMFGLERHYISSMDDYDDSYSYEIPSDIDSRISAFKTKSLQFLYNALKCE
jgi:hypothetical protein